MTDRLAEITKSVAEILIQISPDAGSSGQAETPRRVAKAFLELTSGYGEDPKKILSTTFRSVYDEMVVVKKIPFWSLCEHHMLPFHGTVSIGYLPKERVVGLSKLPRLVQCFARRLQIQEKMTLDIALAIEQNLLTRGVGVVIEAQHTCMQMRGIKSAGSMVTSAMLGEFRDEDSCRAEFLGLLRE